MKQVGILKLTNEALANALGFRDGVTIYGVFTSDQDHPYDTVCIKVRGEGLPEVKEGHAIPFVSLEDVQ